jgi:hypothetical protein
VKGKAGLREGATVFDPSGHRIGHVESPTEGHFFVTHTPLVPLVTERIVVDVAASVERVDAAGVHLRHDTHQLLLRQLRPPESLSSHQLEPGEDPTQLHRGDEDHRSVETAEARHRPSPSARH